MHSVLERQLRKVGASADAPPSPEQWGSFLARVGKAYVQADQERYTLERSIGISSQEMRDLNARLATERDRLYVTIASMADGLCVLDSGGAVQIANPAAERLLCALPDGLSGKNFSDIVSGFWPEHRERRIPLRELRDAIASLRAYRCDDGRFMTLERAWLPVSFALTPIDGTRSERGLVIIFSDIRNRKAAEDSRRESESRFRAIFESAAVGIVRLGLDGRIADCNLTLCNMLGQERESLLEESICEHMHPDEVAAAYERLDKLRLQASVPQTERRYVHRDGSTVWVLEALSLVRGSDGSPVFAIGVLENVTDRKNLEVSLRQAQKLEAVGQLASGIAHEINTPVQFVSDSVHFVREAVVDLLGILEQYRGFRDAASNAFPETAAQLAKAEETADVQYLAQQLPKALERALDGLQRVATIVRGMKAFGHPDAKEKTPADLNHAIQTTLTISRNEYKYVADIETEYGELAPVTCHVGELNQVFLNLIVNAAHAIGDVVQGTEGKGRIGIKTWQDGGSAFIAISDTGGGIPETVRHRIFEPFFTTKAVGRGTGQGLAIARAVVVEKHQGELTFETEVGRGTTFVIRLPIEPLRDGAEAA